MVRVKEKKAKGDDAFKAQKQKVGRKKLAPVTATKAEVHARTLRLDVQRAVAREQEKLKQQIEPVVEPTVIAQIAPPPESELHDAINVAIVGIVHYRAGSRKSALGVCLRWLQNKYTHHGIIAPLRTMQVLDRALNAMVDTDGEVRVAAREVVQYIMSKTFVHAPNLVPAVCGTLLRKFNIAITHAESGARVGCVELLTKVLATHDKHWMEGVSDAEDAANFLTCIAHTQPHLHPEAIRFFEAVIGVVKSCKLWAALSAVVYSFVGTPRVYGGRLSALASSEAVKLATVDIVQHTFPLFKELVETRQALFGFRDKHTRAINMAHCVGALLFCFVNHGLPLPLNRNLQTECKIAFVESLPFTFEDLCGRKSVPALRLVVASASVALPLLRIGATSMATPCIAACRGLFASENAAVATFATHLLRGLLCASVTLVDATTRMECLIAGSSLLNAVPNVISALLKAANPNNSSKIAGQVRGCIEVIEEGVQARKKTNGLLLDLVRVLFLNRSTELEQSDLDEVVRRVVLLITSAVIGRDRIVETAEVDQLRVGVVSLFSVPSTSSVAPVLSKCCANTRFQAAAMALYLGAAVPPEAEVDPRLTATRRYFTGGVTAASNFE